MALAHRPGHAGRFGLGGGVRFSSTSETKTILIPIPKGQVSWRFAIGRVQSAAAAGEPCVHPWVRRGGLPARRSHTSTTPWALGLIPTVRIGAGAWRQWASTRQSGETDPAAIHPHSASQGMQEQKEKSEAAFKKPNRGTDPREQAGPPVDRKPYRYRARLRSTPLRSARSAFRERRKLKT